jgi:hypothetical protein
MTRRSWIGAAAGLAGSGCGRRAAMPPEVFPEAVGGWRRTAAADMAIADAPDPVPRSAVERIRAASYEGPGKLQARVYQLNSAAVGLELVQRWRPSADTVFFNAGTYFVVVKWEQADRAALRTFLQDLEKRLKPKA